jgi:hypothetical protein
MEKSTNQEAIQLEQQESTNSNQLISENTIQLPSNLQFKHIEQTYLKSPHANLPLHHQNKIIHCVSTAITSMGFINPALGTCDQLHHIASNLHAFQADIIGFAETNVKWDTRLAATTKKIFQRSYQTTHITVSSNNEPCLSIYQPGGILLQLQIASLAMLRHEFKTNHLADGLAIHCQHHMEPTSMY